MRPLLLITIDGIDGSGKSMFARRIESALAAAGVATGTVRVDDFRREVSWSDGASEADVYYDHYYDLAMCERVLRGYLDGAGAIEIPAWNNRTDRNEGTRTVDLSGASVVIVEGVFPRRIPTVEAGLGIYLATTEGEARRRILERDRKKGRSEAEVNRRIDERYFPTQRRYIAQFSPQERADVLVDNERPEAPVIVRKDLRRLDPALAAILDAALRVTTV